MYLCIYKFGKMRRISVLFVFLLCGSLLTCTSKKFEPIVCFQDDVLPIFISKCAISGCHDGASKNEVVLTNYENIRKGISPRHPLNSEYYTKISGSNPEMPQSPYPKLSYTELTIIKKWINDGAPNTSGCKSCDSNAYTYSGRISTIMNSWCTGCHNGKISGTPYDLTNYNGVVSAVVALNDPLLGSVKHSAGFSQMPKNAGSISDCDIAAIQSWIKAGYPNN